MPIEFREVRWEEIDEALAFANGLGGDIAKPALRHQLSLVATNSEKAILGSALHESAADGRRLIHIHLKPDTHPGLGRLLIDRALRKSEGADVTTATVKIHHEEAEQTTWSSTDWLSRLRPTTPPALSSDEQPDPAEASEESEQVPAEPVSPENDTADAA
ncbi:hypothetical protein [Algisphaera agarilytica]|uniref:N-acetyltransferase domain-containing protein n=1 Tax=Algisphaera agarilytica TaxID=1385975 RepID=A0A7X0LK08_9BACT|nr:hypothetical protein [Algisphaera agarilytica]MBB6429945.1 hypothetical protein [Algisphaera agarilytica]